MKVKLYSMRYETCFDTINSKGLLKSQRTFSPGVIQTVELHQGKSDNPCLPNEI